ncbi:tetratricopeptide repeat protein [Risungbinella massiliensis]|uniref:tetratricopeptide repeat protein n=1 Tax=Risungbinella massiliensis TaxID=1329796 RepID=UPI0005CBE2F3|nr:tetratricopeptide repeat protein [Risungbinella massiliensis]
MERVHDLPLLPQLERIERALELRRPELAIQLTMEQLQNYPQESDLYQLLAQAYHQQGQQLQAVESMQQALTLDPENADAYAYYGLLLSNEFSRKEAEQSFRYALTLEPDNFLAHYWYASFLWEEKEDYQQTLFHLEKALEQAPLDASCYTLLGLTLAKLGRIKEAEQAIEQAVSLDPEAYDTHYAKGIFTMQYVQDAEKAYPSLLEAVRLNPTDEMLRKHFAAAIGARKKGIGLLWKISFWIQRFGKKIELIFPATVFFLFICGFAFQSNPTLGLIVTIPILIIYAIGFLFVVLVDPLFRKMVEKEERSYKK